MTEQERIEEINSEQLATATDRVLLASRFGRARPSSPRLSQLARTRFANGSSQHPITLHAQGSPELARGSQPHLYSQGTYAPASDAPLYAPQTPARGSSPEIHLAAIASRNQDLTVFTRAPRHIRAAWWKFAATALVTSLVSVAAAIALLV